jgi:Leucine-rich repeat (LRR) protein
MSPTLDLKNHLGQWDHEDKENYVDDTVIHNESADTTEPEWLKVKNAMAQDHALSNVNNTWEQMKKQYIDDAATELSILDETTDMNFSEYSFQDKRFLNLSNPATRKTTSFNYVDSPMAKPKLIKSSFERSRVQEKPLVDIRLITPLDKGMVFEGGAWIFPNAQPKLQQNRYDLRLSDDEDSPAKPQLLNRYDLDLSDDDTSIDHVQVTNVSHLNLSYSESKRHLISVLNDCIESGSDWDEVTHVDLSNKSIVTLKGLDEFLPNLKELDLSSNMITTLEGLPSGLQSLILSKNSITDQVLNFSKFQNLHMLDLSDNHITNLHQFHELNNLRTLKLSGNYIKSLSDLPVVQVLDLSNNSIRGCVDLSLHNFKDMAELNLSGNKITRLKGLSDELRIINMENNNLTSFQIDAKLSNLKKLELRGNTNLNSLKCGTHLKSLRLLTIESGTVVRGDFSVLESLTLIGEHGLERLNDDGFHVNDHLKELRMIKCGITMETLSKIHVALKHIQHFDLRDNAIDGSFVELIQFFKKYLEVGSIRLEGNPIVENLKDQADVDLFHLMIHKLAKGSYV